MQWALLLLSGRFHLQDQLFHDLKDLPLKEVLRHHLLRGVWREALRLHPVAPFISRYLPTDATIGDYSVSKGVSHRDCPKTERSFPNLYPLTSLPPGFNSPVDLFERSQRERFPAAERIPAGKVDQDEGGELSGCEKSVRHPAVRDGREELHRSQARRDADVPRAGAGETSRSNELNVYSDLQLTLFSCRSLRISESSARIGIA